ncbi:MAG: hypothetical protein QGD90_05235 [Candidatus Hydrogenedentes bacterium]|nr:hypothetical protein [Candidatus Hydrogenedentota bacterium]
MSSQIPRGYYEDSEGALRRDRRHSSERRSPAGSYPGEDRRNKQRRKGDQGDLEREHHEMIEEALEEFAAEHER